MSVTAEQRIGADEADKTNRARTTRRNLALLITAQSLGGASPVIIISLGGLVGQALSDDPALLTLPVSLFQLGQAVGTVPMGMLMRRRGRRGAYQFGAGFGVAAGLLAAWGIVSGSFALFCLSTLIAGLYGSGVQSYRFAAADAVPAEQRATAVSRVMIGGLLAAVIGPQLVIWTRDAWIGAPFAGSFISQACLALLALVVVSRLRPAPVLESAVADDAGARPLSQIARQPRFIVAVLAGVVTYGLMSFVMTAAPVAMVGCGHSVGEAALGIQWHVLAMYGPSFFTGRLFARFGKVKITVLGLLLIAAAAVVSLSGLQVTTFWFGLILLGLGWNFGFIGATALVADCYRPSERAKVQTLNDFLVFGTVAFASFSSGRLFTVAGWATINQVVFPLVAVVLLALWWRGRSDKPALTAD